MEHPKQARRDLILERLVAMPQKILSLHGNDNITEFVLNDLCHQNCFNLKKAAYFVDNPDFNYFKGIAGYDVDQLYTKEPDRCWVDLSGFSDHMQQASFNQRVRRFSSHSIKQKELHEDKLLNSLADEFSFIKPQFHCWHLKNNNHGLLIYEHGNGATCSWKPEDLEQGTALLGFCPIF